MLISIHHDCEGEIEKSDLRITDWHHKACRVTTKGDHEGWIFLSHPHMYTKNGFFSCSLLNTSFFIEKNKHENSTCGQRATNVRLFVFIFPTGTGM